jgi:hypothetical protein
MQSDIRENVAFTKPISYDKCCFFGYNTVYDCGPTSHREFYRSLNLGVHIFFQYADHYGWSQGCVTFASLAELDIRSYLKNNQIISKKDDDKIIMNEKNLLANRLLRKNILVEDSMHICPKHRSSFGIDWFNKKTTCHHPDHNSSSSASMNDCRLAKLTTCLKIEGFPIGGR